MIDLNEKLKMAKRGNGDALNDVLRDLETDIRLIARKLWSGRDDLDDLAQVGLCAAMSAVKEFDPDRSGNFRAFALFCARRRMCSEARKLYAKRRNETDIEGAERPVWSGVEDRVFIREIFDALPALLSASELKVFFLKMRGASYGEIAADLGIGVKAADNALSRARSKIYGLYRAV
jgi:RNA polymerase sigma factor (sigma-70 family)